MGGPDIVGPAHSFFKGRLPLWRDPRRRVSFGKGGKHEPDNVALRCRAHNQYQADLDFGTKFMDGRRHNNMPRGLFVAGCS